MISHALNKMGSEFRMRIPTRFLEVGKQREGEAAVSE
jgi:hypothetical protein